MSKPEIPEDDEFTQLREVLNRLSGGRPAGPRRKSKSSKSKSKPPTQMMTGHYGLRHLDPVLIEKLLTSNVASQRVQGRLFATTLLEVFSGFVVAEHERGTDIGLVLTALIEVTATYLSTLIISNAPSDENAQLVAKALAVRFTAYLHDMIELNST